MNQSSYASTKFGHLRNAINMLLPKMSTPTKDRTLLGTGIFDMRLGNYISKTFVPVEVVNQIQMYMHDHYVSKRITANRCESLPIAANC